MAPLPKGIKRVVRRGPDGEIVGVYYYAWRGGPRLNGSPGSREFKASYAAAERARKHRATDTLAGLALNYQASPEFAGLADSTKRQWRQRLFRIVADSAPLDIGGLPLAALNDTRVKADLLAWRDQWKHTPRGADFLMQVLSRVLSWGQQRGLLTINVATGLGQLYKNNRADQIWTADDLAAYEAASSSPEISFVAPLACLTGLRLDDLHTLKWSEVGAVAIVKVTAKGRGKRTAVIPLLGETRTLLSRIHAQQLRRHSELVRRAKERGRAPPSLPLTVLSNTLGRSWRYSGLETRVGETKAAALPPITKHLHDARGTFATRLRTAGLTAPEIADVLGWDENRVERLLAIYVDREIIVKGIAERIQRLEAEALSGRGLSAVPQSTQLLSHDRGAVEVRDGGSPPPTGVQGRGGQNTSTVKRMLIDLCAYVGGQGVERRSTLVSDAWLGVQVARDPWLFRIVDIEPEFHELPDQDPPMRWPIPVGLAERMWGEIPAGAP